jgi:methylated-DNA-[protein]-cysteine S-methyltransferase
MQRTPTQTIESIGDANSVMTADIVAPIQTPIGRLYVAASGAAITAVGRTTAAVEASIRTRFGRSVRPTDALPRPLASAIAAHLQGDPLATLRFDLDGLPDLDRAVAEAVLEIPRGQTRSYGQIARQIGQPWAAKEVGQALNQNPIPVLIPCHRVIYSDGRLGGYVFGSRAKQALLHAEGTMLMTEEVA